jgi:5-methylthioadenosine/S-adenosylhomocysteine deaminase
MKITVDSTVLDAENILHDSVIGLKSDLLNSFDSTLKIKECVAYPPLINSHDHLIGNWFPRAGDSDLYPNAHIWVKDMRESEAVLERDKIWVNSLPMNFFRGNGKLLAQLGGYKNIFSGVAAVQDHAPKQQDEYYEMFPINVIKSYRQAHSLGLGNFWGGEEPVIEWRKSKGKEPFILHLGEGLDEETSKEFSRLRELKLLQPNTMLIHGISLSPKEIEECAENGTSICWCPFSNFFLIGQTLDIDACLKYGVNVVIGTDSSLSGSVNLFQEISFAKEKCPHVSSQAIYRMISENAVKALYLDKEAARLSSNENDSLLLTRRIKEDPFDNILEITSDDIVLLLYKGKPLFGHHDLLQHFSVNNGDYFFYTKNDQKYFVYGHPELIVEKISKILGYNKKLPYLPFQ